ncbi:hydrophobe/amphiphile efflux-3 (HAE3) family transporter [Methanorbis rubei]|uniref:Protein-export membrane protein SecF n=1 Tax=Methanorbis rubei TaxID=3028300 RepID=A0AAE4MHK3_9EURY|nr:Protein-export membrane protein SecF [Methanocorpusculaceae archaeon Cs1]
MISPFEKINHFINKYPFIVGCILILIVLVSIYGSTSITLSTTIQMPDKNDHAAYVFQDYLDNFETDPIILMVQGDDVRDVNIMQSVVLLEQLMRQEDGVTNVESVYDIVISYTDGVAPANQEIANEIFAQIPEDVLSSSMPDHQLLLVEITTTYGMSDDQQMKLLDALETLLPLVDLPPAATLTFAGDAALNNDMGSTLTTEVGKLLGAAFILMLTVLMVLFHHARYTLLSIVSVLNGLLMTFGVMGLLKIPLSMATLGALPILLGIGVDYAIQFHSRFDDEIREHPLPDALKTTITKTGSAVFFAMIASALGFVAMQVSTLPDIRQFGLVAILGLACCYVSAILIIPLTAILTDYKPKPMKTPKSGEKPPLTVRYNEFLRKTALKVTKYAVPILLILCVIGVVGLYVDEEIPINTDIETYVPADMPALININTVTSAIGDLDGMQVEVTGGNLLSPDALEWMYDWGNNELVAHEWRFISVTSIATIIADANNGVLPASQQEIDEIFATLPEEKVRPYLNGGQTAIISFGMNEISQDLARSLTEQVTRDIAFYQPPADIEAVVTGAHYSDLEMMKEMKLGKMQMTVLAFIIIFLFLTILYRSMGKAVVPLIPIVMIIGWNGAAMYILGIEYNVLTATMGAMTIGIAAEYCIMMIERIYEEMETNDTLTAVQNGTGKIGSAITVSACTTMAAFTALTVSDFPVISMFGVVTVIAMAFTLIGAIVAVPAAASIVLRGKGKGDAQPRL